MRIALITAPTVTDFSDPEELSSESVVEQASSVHLGVLTVAAIAEAWGAKPSVIDVNRLYYQYWQEPSGFPARVDFAAYAAESISLTKSDIYGFSSICSSYPLTIRIAAHLRRICQGAHIVFGGPQATVVDRETLLAFPFVDFVLRGETDLTFPALLSELSGNRRFDQVRGLTKLSRRVQGHANRERPAC